ncbi:2OG-Fe(II) oxygenase [Xanthomonas maliensis]|uniref:2OG-Fe(II) oxygenase n=1 Tax=Xanthomonas maliensis TaxID=1321368 RepID=UPI0009DC3D6F|nr:2OG-Fe(II) oxygenase [Xanthomonas maliensis]
MPQLMGGGWSYSVYPGLLGDTHPSWHMHLCGSRSAHDRAIHDDVLNATPGLAALNEVWKYIQQELAPDYGLVRAYATGHTYGQDGALHHYAKPSDQERVALLYTSAEWKDDWAGETVFYDPARECISIRPRPGRLVLFDGSVTRVSRAPARDCPTLCSTLAFHMRRLRR